MMEQSYRIITPENVELEYEIAGIGSRFLAASLDLIIQGLLIAGLGYGLSLAGLKETWDGAHIRDFAHSILGAAYLALLGIILLGYYIILETAFNGQTIGKRLVRIRVRKDQGYAPGFIEILLRNIIRIVDFMPFGYAIGFVAMFLNPSAKRLGDLAAGTIVVKEMSRRKVHDFLDSPSPDTSFPPNVPDLTAIYPWLNTVLPFISQQDYYLMENLSSRKTELTNFMPLAQEIVTQIIRKVPDCMEFAISADDAVVLLPELIHRYERAHFR